MSENILSLEDLKFLEQLHQKFGISFLRYDDEGLKMNQDISGGQDFANNISEISKKLKFRLNSNFQLNFYNGFHFDVVRV